MGKRNAKDGIEKAVSAKKQNTAPEKVTTMKEDAKKVKKQPPWKKVESSSSEEYSSDSSDEEATTADYQPRSSVVALSQASAPTVAAPSVTLGPLGTTLTSGIEHEELSEDVGVREVASLTAHPVASLACPMVP
ncbi:hypothetical protein GUJ93_ZPchr0458g22419 [Zizania palustris]|uniref:Uncharacterized protein n=1 Tax=Zizania palustris TaxID=103762 RepID=A0A8J5RDU1_ZIZPA|nr:hypothetical protein GUJ93_ZPchr0458g22419 [Zizania palustris]